MAPGVRAGEEARGHLVHADVGALGRQDDREQQRVRILMLQRDGGSG